MRPIEVLSLTRDDVNLPGHLSLDGVKQNVIGLIITNCKTAKKGKAQLSFLDDEIALKWIEALMGVNTRHTKTAYLLDNTAYAQLQQKICKAHPDTKGYKAHA